MDPIHVFTILILFKGVYIQVYRIRFDAPSTAVNPLHPKYKMERPEVLAIKAKLSACKVLQIKTFDDYKKNNSKIHR